MVHPLSGQSCHRHALPVQRDWHAKRQWLNGREEVHAYERAHLPRYEKITGDWERVVLGDSGGPAVAAACREVLGEAAYQEQAAAWRADTAKGLQSPSATVRFDKRFTLEGQRLGNAGFSTALPPLADGCTPPPEEGVKGAGVLLAENDGRVWLTEPGGGFGATTMPSPRATMKAAA